MAWPVGIRLVLGAVCGALLLAPAAQAARTYHVPRSIARDCSADVGGRLTAWIRSVPDGSVLAFARGGCYRVEGTLEIANRSRLRFEGRGATFRATMRGDVHRAHWRVVGGAHITFRGMMVRGANPAGGTFAGELQHQHAFELNGVRDVELDRVTASGVYGDCVYVGRRDRVAGPWSRGVRVRRSRCLGTGRMGVAIVAGRRVRVARTRFGGIARTALDIEPNGPGFGARDVAFLRNVAAGPLPGGFFTAIGSGPVANVRLEGNRTTGVGMYMAVLPRPGERHSGFTIAGNSSDTAYHAPGSAALDFERVDGLTVTGNRIPVTGPNMALAWVAESCGVRIRGNRAPGASVQARIAPYAC